jgi:hypothetical protein
MATGPNAAASAAPAGRHQPLPAGLELLGRGPGDQKTELKHLAEQVASDVPLVEHMSEVMPAADFFFGGAMLLLIVVIHAFGMRALTNQFERRLQRVRSMHSTWRPDLILVAVVAMMLMLHLTEIFAWSAALVWSGLVTEWRAAGFFAANTYTTVGYGSFVLPYGWHMLAPIIAISGLFTFGWTGSVLVEVVRRCQEAKAGAIRARTARKPPHDPPSAGG